MFTVEPKNNDRLDNAIDNLLAEMSLYEGHTQEYMRLVDRLETLMRLRETNNPQRVSADTLAIVIGNLVGIVLIVGHERMNVIGSKALSFVLKLR